MTTNGIGSAATTTPIEEGKAMELASASGRVVRTVEYLTSTSPSVKKEAKLVLQIDTYSNSLTRLRPGATRG